ncbi:MAG: hypothetical protein ACXAEU_06890 [Candidatus Hodarchaeales archaeon]|jgi:hypothetical protein
MTYQRKNRTKFLIVYHFIFVVKYRKPILVILVKHQTPTSLWADQWVLLAIQYKNKFKASRKKSNWSNVEPQETEKH